ncbi:MAG: N-acetyltransferase [Brevibacillus sp.]|nr:N-acetyltransferase [Brevibacillus sp.]
MSKEKKQVDVRIEPWKDTDLDLLFRLNAPEMLEHLGGPETEEQVLRRHQRYVNITGNETGQMFTIVMLPESEPVGNIGYWERIWEGETVYEIGWGVLSAYQGLGIASAATKAAIASARAENKHRFLHAFPSVDNPASNGICRKLSFTLRGECNFEYPPGSMMRCNDWFLDLTTVSTN